MAVIPMDAWIDATTLFFFILTAVIGLNGVRKAIGTPITPALPFIVVGIMMLTLAVAVHVMGQLAFGDCPQCSSNVDMASSVLLILGGISAFVGVYILFGIEQREMLKVTKA